MFKPWVLVSWTLSSVSFGNILGVRASYVFGTVSDGTAKLEKKGGLGESVWSGDYSRYHVLRFLSFTTMILPNIRCQCPARVITGWFPPPTLSFPFNKNGEMVVGVRGPHDEMI